MPTNGSGVILWLILAVALFIIEGATVQLICIWFACGALLAMVAAWLGAPFVMQLTVFLVSSVAAILLGRPFFARRLSHTKAATNADLVVGQAGVVLEEINNIQQTGRVSANGLDWTARSLHDDATIPAGTKVRAVRIDGVKLIVEPLSQKEEEML